jgi:long-chain-alcohol oxidase
LSIMVAGKKQNKARGVVAKIANSNRTIFIQARAVVVAAGSLFTPPLLLNSGLLNPNIGRGLHLHPVTFMWGYFPQGCGPSSGSCYEGAIMTAYSPLYKAGAKFPSGLLETPSTHPGCFATFQPWVSGKDHVPRHGINFW